ncbi:hypothetical protein MBLNU230_g6514t1 [Neophaeotheca triangularis]
MPGRRDQAIPLDPSLCRRCQTNSIAITVRTEPLCSDCFKKYVHTKVVKRMETFRVRHSTPDKERVLLLPLSLGASSVALLHILSQHLQRQIENTGRTGFKLLVVHISLPTYSNQARTQTCLEKLKLRYPQHDYATHPLSALFDPSVIPTASLPLALQPPTPDPSPETHLTTLIDSLKSPTSKSDILSLLLTNLLTHLAHSHSTEAILWGSSTTRLAQRTLAETAKGRGGSLPWYVADAASTNPSAPPSYYPMRDLLGKEIESFGDFVEPLLREVVLEEAPKPAVSTRNSTIDELMVKYFEGVERDFPSIVSNVVKTAGKLELRRGDVQRDVEAIETVCELCSLPLSDASAPARSRLCYGCVRTLGRGEA